MADDYEGSASGAVPVTNGPPMFKFPEDVKLFKPITAGPVVFDIMPYKISSKQHPFVISGAHDVGDNTMRFYYARHYIGGKNNGKYVVCPRATLGHACPVCDYQQKQADELAAAKGKQFLGKGEWPDELIKLFPQYRVMFQVRKVGEPDNLYVMDQSASGPPKKDGSVNTKAYDYKFNTAMATHKTIKKLEKFPLISPTEGSSVVVNVSMASNPVINAGKPFAEFDGIQFIDREVQYATDIADKSFDPFSAMNILSYEELERLMYGVEPENQEEPAQEEHESGFVDDIPGEKPINKPVTSQCPNGLKFGTDWLKEDVCEECPQRKNCREEQKRQNADAL